MVRKKVKKLKEVKLKKPEEKYSWLKNISITVFGNFVDKYVNQFETIREPYFQADIGFLFRTYLAIMFFVSALVFFETAIILSIFCLIFEINILLSIIGVILISSITSLITFLAFYIYPTSKAKRRKTNIETNLPFAIAHMSAVAGSGAPPTVMFKILSKFQEYGEISKEAGKIIRNIEFFGLDEITATKDVISKTPSNDFKNLLEGIVTTVQTGGNLKSYLKHEADEALFEYRLNRERYMQLLSVYADFYTALLIAAPLLFIAILSILSVIGGTLFGMPIQDLMKIGIFGFIPALNIAFLLFIHVTQPKM